MEQYGNDGRDGLERFFQGKLRGYQDDPSDALWERISGGIPAKPKPRYQPALMWVGRSVAACLVLALSAGLIQYRYDKQLDDMAQQLAKSRQELASLEERINAFQHNPGMMPSQPVAAHLNQKPQAQGKMPTAKIVYMPMPPSTASIRPDSPLSDIQPKDTAPTFAAQQAKADEAQGETTRHAAAPIAYRTSTFTISNFDPAEKERILDLRRVQVPQTRRLNLPSTEFTTPQDKFGIRHGGMAQAASFGAGQFMPQPDLSLGKIKGMGGQFHLSGKLSVFMAPDYWNPNTQPRTLYSNADYSYPIGLESGLTYRF